MPWLSNQHYLLTADVLRKMLSERERVGNLPEPSFLPFWCKFNLSKTVNILYKCIYPYIYWRFCLTDNCGRPSKHFRRGHGLPTKKKRRISKILALCASIFIIWSIKYHCSLESSPNMHSMCIMGTVVQQGALTIYCWSYEGNAGSIEGGWEMDQNLP